MIEKALARKNLTQPSADRGAAKTFGSQPPCGPDGASRLLPPPRALARFISAAWRRLPFRGAL